MEWLIFDSWKNAFAIIDMFFVESYQFIFVNIFEKVSSTNNHLGQIIRAKYGPTAN